MTMMPIPYSSAPRLVTRDELVKLFRLMFPGETLDLAAENHDGELIIMYGVYCVITPMREAAVDPRTWVFDFYGGGTPYVYSAIAENELDDIEDMGQMFVDYGIFQQSKFWYIDMNDDATIQIVERMESCNEQSSTPYPLKDR